MVALERSDRPKVDLVLEGGGVNGIGLVGAVLALLKGGEYSTAELADLFGVARSTVYRAVERERTRNVMGIATMVG